MSLGNGLLGWHQDHGLPEGKGHGKNLRRSKIGGGSLGVGLTAVKDSMLFFLRLPLDLLQHFPFQLSSLECLLRALQICLV